MAIIKALNILLQADPSKFNKGLAEVTKSLKKFGKSAIGGGKLVGSVLGAGAAAGAAGLTALTYSSMQNADEVKRNADLVGSSVNSFDSLSHAATLADLDASTLSDSMKKLGVNLATSAKTGKGGVADTLKELGLSAVDLLNQAPDERIKTIATAMEGITDPAERARISTQLFGKAGKEMGTFLGQGGAAIQEMQDRANQLGIALTDVDAANIAAANDQMDTLAGAVQGVGNRIGSAISPFIVTLGDQFLDSGLLGLTATENWTSGFEAAIEMAGEFYDALHLVRGGFGETQVGATQALQATLRFFGSSELADAMDLEIEAMQKRQVDLWSNDRTGRDGAKKLIADARAAAAKAREEIGKPTDRTPFTDLDEDADKAMAKIDDFAAKLEAEIFKKQNSLEGVDAEIWDLQQANPDADLGQIRGLAKTLKEMDELEDKRKKLDDFSKDILKDIATPDEKLTEHFTKLIEAKDAGMISVFDFIKAKDKATEDILGKADQNRFAGLFEKGSQDAANAIVRHKFGGEKNDVQSRQLQVQQALLKATETVANNTGGVVTVGFN